MKIEIDRSILNDINKAKRIERKIKAYDNYINNLQTKNGSNKIKLTKLIDSINARIYAASKAMIEE